MQDIARIMDRVCGELDKIAEKGINTSNLESTYKLADIYKDLKNAEYWERKGEYYTALLEEMQDGYSQDGGYRMEGDGYSARRKRDSMGRYSRDDGWTDTGDDRGSSYRRGYSRNRDGYSGDTYERYMDQKQSYRAAKTPECKQRLMDALDEHMDRFTKQMEEMLRDSDCAEERTTIRHYLDKIKNLA